MQVPAVIPKFFGRHKSRVQVVAGLVVAIDSFKVDADCETGQQEKNESGAVEDEGAKLHLAEEMMKSGSIGPSALPLSLCSLQRHWPIIPRSENQRQPQGISPEVAA